MRRVSPVLFFLSVPPLCKGRVSEACPRESGGGVESHAQEELATTTTRGLLAPGSTSPHPSLLVVSREIL